MLPRTSQQQHFYFVHSIQYQEVENRTTVMLDFGDRTVTSSLTIRMAMVNDSGEYVCRTTSPPYAPVSSDPALVLVQGTNVYQPETACNSALLYEVGFKLRSN